MINALGDAIMALGFFLLIAKLGSLDFGVVFDAAESGELSDTVVTLVALALLGGAVAKSAQIPFHTWLPDAMEGPTPVSALIHAATMVTAGVYLICRTHPVFEAAPDVQHLAAILGLVTLLVAGVVALVQWDIKRVIAYSTMSQIGYMFVGAGVGAYGFAMFHLFTHAFFKALLFLAAGHGDPSPPRRAGHPEDGRPPLARCRSPTRRSSIGTLALIGIPPLSGFWSKDAIIASAGADGRRPRLDALHRLPRRRAAHRALRDPPLLLRLPRGARRGRRARTAEHGHHGEGPQSMTIPVAVLARRLGDRRLPPDPRRLGAVRHVDRPGRASRSSIRPSPRTT